MVILGEQMRREQQWQAMMLGKERAIQPAALPTSQRSLHRPEVARRLQLHDVVVELLQLAVRGVVAGGACLCQLRMALLQVGQRLGKRRHGETSLGMDNN